MENAFIPCSTPLTKSFYIHAPFLLVQISRQVTLWSSPTYLNFSGYFGLNYNQFLILQYDFIFQDLT